MLGRVGTTLFVLTATSAVVGGGYFGLLSCGGYGSVRVIFDTAFVFAVLAMLAVPPLWARRFRARTLLAAAVVTTFLLSRAMASAFYPAAPNSVGEFLRLAWSALQNGPC